MAEALAAGGHDPAELVEQRDLGRRIEAAIRTLPPEQREVFVLRTQGNVSFKEIAKTQGISINTALARMQYAMQKLRKLLREDYARVRGAL